VRFLVLPGPEQLERIRPPVRWFLLFAALLLVAMAAQRGASGGLTPAGVEGHYLGADGSERLPAIALWEELHQNAFIYGFLLLTLGSLLAVSPLSPRARGVVVLAASAAALADCAAPFAVVTAGGLGALRVATFAAALLGLAASIAASWAMLGRGPRRGGA